jgi:hypothetical protein
VERKNLGVGATIVLELLFNLEKFEIIMSCSLIADKPLTL